VTRDKWAIELDEIEGTVTRVSNGMDISSHVKTVVVYRREADGEWKVARLMELLD
jgi:ketosteroid isomerase-like protein